jgi:hypothetical protein
MFVHSNNSLYILICQFQAYRALNELETKAKENKTQQKHEQALQEFFVRTEPLGFDRNRRLYWQFTGDAGRLFVETKQQIPEEEYHGLRPPPLLAQNPSTLEEEENKMLNVLFQSRPHRFRSIWHVYSTPTELYRLWYSLDERGEREKELKELIASRYELEEPKQEYSTTGSEYIGRQVTRTFGNKVMNHDPYSCCIYLFEGIGGHWNNCWMAPPF